MNVPVLPALVAPYAFAGLAVQVGGAAPTFDVQTAPAITASQHSFWRAASISKIVVGQVVRQVVGEGAATADVSDILGWPLRHPGFRDVPILLGQLASHSAGLSDAGGYAVPVGVPLRDWIGAANFGADAPGQRFEYCNLGYILMAAVAEAVAGAPFDALAQRLVLRPAGVEAGFNWSGLGAAARTAALPTYRWDGARFAAQIDDAVPLMGISGPVGGAYARDRSVSALSPQGGLRLSLVGALDLARHLPKLQTDVLWSPDMGRMDDPDRVFDGYGWGLQIFDDPWFYPHRLIGHFASAYGFAGGVWYDADADIAFAYGLNGKAEGDESDAFSRDELAVFQAIAELAA